jgi:glycosyltransferase involved in cell wall biosynthesis
MNASIFAIRGVAASIDRYASELAKAFPAHVQVRQYAPPLRRGVWGAIWHRRIKYFMGARGAAGDCNIIVNPTDAYLLLGLDPQRTLVVCHDVHPLLYKGWVGTYRMRLKLNLWLARRARAIVAVSEHTRQDLLKYCPFIPARKVVAIHNGLAETWRPVTDADERDSVARKLGIAGKKIVLHVGSDVWYKNFASVLRAFSRLPDNNLVLVKVGDLGDASGRLLRELSLEKRVLHLGHAADSELRALYSLAEVLVFPSLHEGFGWPPLEAMACGCPVIASRRGSLPEVCGDACLYVDPLDYDDIAAAIARVLSDPELKATLGTQGRSRAAAFSWRLTAERMLELVSEKEETPVER